MAAIAEDTETIAAADTEATQEDMATIAAVAEAMIVAAAVAAAAVADKVDVASDCFRVAIALCHPQRAVRDYNSRQQNGQRIKQA